MPACIRQCITPLNQLKLSHHIMVIGLQLAYDRQWQMGTLTWPEICCKVSTAAAATWTADSVPFKCQEDLSGSCMRKRGSVLCSTRDAELAEGGC